MRESLDTIGARAHDAGGAPRHHPGCCPELEHVRLSQHGLPVNLDDLDLELFAGLGALGCGGGFVHRELSLRQTGAILATLEHTRSGLRPARRSMCTLPVVIWLRRAAPPVALRVLGREVVRATRRTRPGP